MAPPVGSQISIVELEKSQRQQELLQLKSYSPCEGSLYHKGLPGLEALPRPPLDHHTPKLSLAAAGLSGLSPELSINGIASPCFHRGGGGTKGELLSRYLPISPDHEIVPPTPDARHRQLGHPLPDYTRYSPAKIALRRHLNQDCSMAHFRGLGFTGLRLVRFKIYNHCRDSANRFVTCLWSTVFLTLLFLQGYGCRHLSIRS